MTTNINLEAELSRVLLTLCARVFPDVAPEGTQAPYVVWHQYGGTAPIYTEGELLERRNSFVQINAWAQSRAQANTLSLDIEQALVANQLLQAQPLNAISTLYDEDTTLRGSMQDFSLWMAR